MRDTILFGQGRQINEIPRKAWKEQLSQLSQSSETRLRFMSELHHLVRNFVVRELPLANRPIPSDFISRSLGLPLARVETVLDELEKNLFFLVRNSQGAVSWAYPVTVEKTPHGLSRPCRTGSTDRSESKPMTPPDSQLLPRPGNDGRMKNYAALCLHPSWQSAKPSLLIPTGLLFGVLSSKLPGNLQPSPAPSFLPDRP